MRSSILALPFALLASDRGSDPLDFLPKDAVVVESHEEAAPKTIYVLPDKHVDTEKTPEANGPAQEIQNFQLEVVRALVRQHGRVALVVENMIEGTDQARFLSDFSKAYPANQPYHPGVQLIVQELGAQIDLLASVPAREEGRVRQLGGKNYREAEFFSEHADTTYCQKPDGSRVYFTTIAAEFQAGQRDSFTIDCYCHAARLTAQYYPEFAEDRTLLAPRRETAAAFAAKEDVVVIISGIGHRPETVNQLLAGEASFYVLQPKGVHLEPFPVQAYPDDAQGTCHQWALTQ